MDRALAELALKKREGEFKFTLSLYRLILVGHYFK